MPLAYFSAEILFLLVLTGFVISHDCSTATIQHDTYLKHQVFRKLGISALYHCAAECLTSSVCLSFAFEHKTRTCFLNSNDSAQVSIFSRSGFDFSDILPWNKALSGPCVVMSCPMTTRCHVDRNGRATCVPEFTGCGRPPDVPFASVTYDGHYKGAVARYTCEEDYTVCHQRNTSVCQASGDWEKIAGLCRRFRWRNPRVDILYDMPCGPQSTFNLLVLATLTAPTRCSVDLWAGEDVTFHSDFRLNAMHMKKTTVINARFRHSWGNQLSRFMPLTVGKESEIRISLSNGVYKLMVDGITIVWFPERQAGVQPDRLRLYKDCNLRLIEISH